MIPGGVVLVVKLSVSVKTQMFSVTIKTQKSVKISPILFYCHPNFFYYTLATGLIFFLFLPICRILFNKSDPMKETLENSLQHHQIKKYSNSSFFNAIPRYMPRLLALLSNMVQDHKSCVRAIGFNPRDP